MGFVKWTFSNPLHQAGERMDTYLALADRLDLMGEPDWAREQRENAWLAVLRELESFRDARRNPWPYPVAVTSAVAIVLGMAAMILSQVPWVFTAGTASTLLGLLGWIWYTTHEARRVLKISAAAKQSWAWHLERGDVARFERSRAASTTHIHNTSA